MSDLALFDSGPTLAAHRWPSNAELIMDCVRLGYLRFEWRTLDPTYGNGIWWGQWRPNDLVTHDLKLDGQDFRDLPYESESFDAIAFDPPYVAPGGLATDSGVQEMYDAYGVTPRTPADLQRLINDGLTEMFRLLKLGGYCLVKCQDYISSGKLWLGTHHTLTHALSLGFECFDRLEHVGDPRPQPKRDRQIHARRNLSTLFVFRKSQSVVKPRRVAP